MRAKSPVLLRRIAAITCSTTCHGKWESAKYLHEVLEQMTEENMNYPEKAE